MAIRIRYPFVERTAGAGKGLLKRLADEAAVVVTDDFPAFFLPGMIAAAGRALDVSLEAVDGNGLLPLAAKPSLGRYDRAWGPERSIFGKIRYMSSENTARKLRVKNYIARYA